MKSTVKFDLKDLERSLSSSITEEEQTILDKIRAEKDRNFYIQKIIAKYAELYSISEKEDEEYAKIILTFIKHFEIDDQIFSEIATSISSRFTSKKYEFIDRACFVATALFQKDDFNVQEKNCYSKFKVFLKEGIVKEKLKSKKYETIFDRNEYVENDCLDLEVKPKFIQQALKLLTGDNKASLKIKACKETKNILARASRRSIEFYKNGLFKQLITLNHPEIYDFQFKALAHLLIKDKSLFKKACEIFFDSELECLRFYIIYTFCRMHIISNDETRMFIHITFNEMLIQRNTNFQPSVSQQISTFLQLGVKFLSELKKL